MAMKDYLLTKSQVQRITIKVVGEGWVQYNFTCQKTRAKTVDLENPGELTIVLTVEEATEQTELSRGTLKPEPSEGEDDGEAE